MHMYIYILNIRAIRYMFRTFDRFAFSSVFSLSCRQLEFILTNVSNTLNPLLLPPPASLSIRNIR